MILPRLNALTSARALLSQIYANQTTKHLSPNCKLSWVKLLPIGNSALKNSLRTVIFPKHVNSLVMLMIPTPSQMLISLFHMSAITYLKLSLNATTKWSSLVSSAFWFPSCSCFGSDGNSRALKSIWSNSIAPLSLPVITLSKSNSTRKNTMIGMKTNTGQSLWIQESLLPSP